MTSKPERKMWHDMELVRISDVGDNFSKWLYGQTIPLVEDDATPFDWAYSWDYDKFIRGGRVTD